ncbi:hypothetical protein AB0D34_08230 [Streptomyces sp. NPDC048420]|uniref:hypothetical protein n=1 Tax=Streptomyces sp. NPDC048420 TaxID=3155755 RepID=UPI003412737B
MTLYRATLQFEGNGQSSRAVIRPMLPLSGDSPCNALDPSSVIGSNQEEVTVTAQRRTPRRQPVQSSHVQLAELREALLL